MKPIFVLVVLGALTLVGSPVGVFADPQSRFDSALIELSRERNAPKRLEILESLSKVSRSDFNSGAAGEARRQAALHVLLPLIESDPNSSARAWARSILRDALSGRPALQKDVIQRVEAQAASTNRPVGLADEIDLLSGFDKPTSGILTIYDSLRSRPIPKPALQDAALAQIANALGDEKHSEATGDPILVLEDLLTDSSHDSARAYASVSLHTVYRRAREKDPARVAQIDSFLGEKSLQTKPPLSGLVRQSILETGMKLGSPAIEPAVLQALGAGRLDKVPPTYVLAGLCGGLQSPSVLGALTDSLSRLKGVDLELALKAADCQSGQFSKLPGAHPEAQLAALRKVAELLASGNEDLRIRAARLWGKLSLALLLGSQAGVSGDRQELSQRIKDCFVESGRPFNPQAISGSTLILDFFLFPFPLFSTSQMAREIETSSGGVPIKADPHRVPRMTRAQIDGLQAELQAALSKL